MRPVIIFHACVVIQEGAKPTTTPVQTSSALCRNTFLIIKIAQLIDTLLLYLYAIIIIMEIIICILKMYNL